jgi:hypothetical protein
MSDHKRHTTITPAPIPRTQPATIGDAMELDAQHAAECTDERRKECEKRDIQRADKDGIFWARIVATEKSLASIVDNIRFLKWCIVLACPLLLTLGIFVAKYAIVGAITLELDKHIPPGVHLSVEKATTPAHYAQVPAHDP